MMRKRPQAGPMSGAVLAVALSGALAGCSADQAPNAAAVDRDGDVIATVDEVQQVSEDLMPLATGQDGTPVPRRTVELVVLQSLVAADEVRAAARSAGVVVSGDTLQQAVLTQAGVSITLEAAEVLATSQMYSQLVQAGQGQEVADQVIDSGVTLNPRYGELTTDQGVLRIGDEPLPWITSAAAEG